MDRIALNDKVDIVVPTVFASDHKIDYLKDFIVHMRKFGNK